MKIFRKTLITVIVAALLINICGCSSSKNIMDDVTAQKVTALENLSGETVIMNDFSVKFLNACHNKGKNTFVSPLSAAYALGLTINGADGETLTQMEKTLGMKRQDLNLYLYSLMQSLNKDIGTESNAKFNLANSVWFTDSNRFEIKKDFLQANADYYKSQIYREPFDSSTVKKVNDWVSEQTNGMIKDIVNDSFFSENAIMCLVNALCFEGEWQEIYTENDVKKDTFTNASGKKQKCDFMFSEESSFIEDDNATGFIKYYKNSTFAFVAVLPNKGITADEYVSALTGEKLTRLLESRRNATVNTSMPKFEAEYTLNLSDPLKKMGMPLAFDSSHADFSAMGSSSNGNIYIKYAIQKNYISVAEQGTKAGAATVIYAEDFFALPQEVKYVYLNRPFVYMIIDTVTNVPLFIGTMNNV